jgi:hypothetical protein
MLLNGPPQPIIQALQLLCDTDLNQVENDSAPSIGIPAVLLALQAGGQGRWAEEHLSEDMRGKMQRSFDDRERRWLVWLESESLSPTRADAPFWTPYGGYSRMLYDTALTTVDLLTLLPRPPWDSIFFVLNALAKRATLDGGLPYSPERDKADVGLSAYFAALCHRSAVVGAGSADSRWEGIASAGKSALDFAVSASLGGPLAQYTYCDTVANILAFADGDQ